VEAIFVLIGISLLVAIGFLLGFIWAVRTKQYDDDFTPSVRMLFDDGSKTKQEKNTTNKE